jgi:beta-lactamase class A
MPITSDYSDGVPVIAYCLADMRGTVLAERHADLRFYAASTIKLAVLIAVVRAVERGRLSLDQAVAATHTFRSGVGDGAEFSFDPAEYDGGMPPPGRRCRCGRCCGG